MSQQEVVSSREYVGTAELLNRSDLERILAPYKKADQYEAILRYYQGGIDARDDQSLLRPLALLNEALGSLVPPVRQRRDTEEIGLPATLPRRYWSFIKRSATTAPAWFRALKH
ncbi:hypothetical protein [Pseudomonas sp. B21-053]|uniref:hypothetical protein n=1 Tax=Pseudomonas sp. B21-053 TaxID=2895493 RepID=UPI002230A183|nr:hypothetical protein [Pseudomonas sp. B21-053]UZE12620.1 hypothetical protein LOY68_03125 [Pseudomonas sp. B21-053]